MTGAHDTAVARREPPIVLRAVEVADSDARLDLTFERTPDGTYCALELAGLAITCVDTLAGREGASLVLGSLLTLYDLRNALGVLITEAEAAGLLTPAWADAPATAPAGDAADGDDAEVSAEYRYVTAVAGAHGPLLSHTVAGPYYADLELNWRDAAMPDLEFTHHDRQYGQPRGVRFILAPAGLRAFIAALTKLADAADADARALADVAGGKT